MTEISRNRLILYVVLSVLATGVLVAGYITSDIWVQVFAGIIKGAAA